MAERAGASRDLLFGLLTLQTGLVDEGGLFTAFNAWTRAAAASLVVAAAVQIGHSYWNKRRGLGLSDTALKHEQAKAIAAGYHHQEHLQNDADLDPIRQYPGNRLVLLDLAFPTDPFAH